MPMMILVMLPIAIIMAVFTSPLSFVFLLLASVSSVLPNAAITLPLSCAMGALATLGTILAKSSQNPIDASIAAAMVGLWGLIYVFLYVFVSAGLWRGHRKRRGAKHGEGKQVENPEKQNPRSMLRGSSDRQQ